MATADTGVEDANASPGYCFTERTPNSRRTEVCQSADAVARQPPLLEKELLRFSATLARLAYKPQAEAKVVRNHAGRRADFFYRCSDGSDAVDVHAFSMERTMYVVAKGTEWKRESVLKFGSQWRRNLTPAWVPDFIKEPLGFSDPVRLASGFLKHLECVICSRFTGVEPGEWKVIFIGHSRGAALAELMANQAADHLRAPVFAVVLFGAMATRRLGRAYFPTPLSLRGRIFSFVAKGDMVPSVSRFLAGVRPEHELISIEGGSPQPYETMEKCSPHNMRNYICLLEKYYDTEILPRLAMKGLPPQPLVYPAAATTPWSDLPWEELLSESSHACDIRMSDIYDASSGTPKYEEWLINSGIKQYVMDASARAQPVAFKKANRAIFTATGLVTGGALTASAATATAGGTAVAAAASTAAGAAAAESGAAMASAAALQSGVLSVEGFGAALYTGAAASAGLVAGLAITAAGVALGTGLVLGWALSPNGPSPITSMSFLHGTDRLAVAFKDGHVQVLDISGNGDPEPSHTVSIAWHTMNCVTWGPSRDSLVTGGASGGRGPASGIQYWGAKGRLKLWNIGPRSLYQHGVALRIWHQPATDKDYWAQHGHGPVDQAAVSPAGLIVTLSRDCGTVCLHWPAKLPPLFSHTPSAENAGRSTVLLNSKDHASPRALAVSQNTAGDCLLAVSCAAELRLYSVTQCTWLEGKASQLAPGGGASLCAWSYSESSQAAAGRWLACAVQGGTVLLYDTLDWEPMRLPVNEGGSGDAVRDMCWAPDGSLLAVAAGDSIYIVCPFAAKAAYSDHVFASKLEKRAPPSEMSKLGWLHVVAQQRDVQTVAWGATRLVYAGSSGPATSIKAPGFAEGISNSTWDEEEEELRLEAELTPEEIDLHYLRQREQVLKEATESCVPFFEATLLDFSDLEVSQVVPEA